MKKKKKRMKEGNKWDEMLRILRAANWSKNEG